MSTRRYSYLPVGEGAVHPDTIAVVTDYDKEVLFMSVSRQQAVRRRSTHRGQTLRGVYWLTWLWPTIIMLSALAAGLVAFVFPGTVVRPALIMWFLFVCPGMTAVRFFRFSNIVVDYILAVALSIAIDAFIAGIMLYAGWWSPARILSILMGFCLIGVSMRLVVIYTRAAEPRASDSLCRKY